MVWHSKSNCRDEHLVAGSNHSPESSTRPQQQTQQSARRGVGRSEERQPRQAMVGQSRPDPVCHQCGQTGHLRRTCKAPKQSDKGRAAEQQWQKTKDAHHMDKGTGRALDKGKALYVDDSSECSDDSRSQIEMLRSQSEMLTNQVAQLQDIITQQKGDGAGPSGYGGQPAYRGFMAQQVHPAWAPTVVSDGFAFADSYSSDEGGTGMLASRALKPGFVPHGLIPARLVNTANTRQRGRPTAAAAAVATPAPAAARQNVPASARRQERMRDPDHDEDRALRNRLPTGMVNPVDLPAYVAPAVEAGPEVEQDHHSIQVMRAAHLVSLLRTSLSTARFNALPTEIVADNSAEGAEAWQRAKADALAGRLHNGQDARSIAWHNAIERAVHLWAAQAQLTWRDYAQLDMRRIFREAASATFGPATAVHAALEPQQPCLQEAGSVVAAARDSMT